MAAAKDEMNTPLIVTIGVLFVVLTFVLIILLQVYFYKAQAKEYTRKVIEPKSAALSSHLADQTAELHSYRWIDQQKGIVGIPIERAMELVVAESPDRPAGRNNDPN
jgi:hypothetical protein